jgi:NAD(P)-dependent dehydrogenase (short-subunit alcohol dehydrogenase family)
VSEIHRHDSVSPNIVGKNAPINLETHRLKGASSMILVTGAGGSNGSELIKQLSATGASVRAMVRKRRDLENGALPGVEFVTADFDDLASVNRALEGVQSAFLVTN